MSAVALRSGVYQVGANGALVLLRPFNRTSAATPASKGKQR